MQQKKYVKDLVEIHNIKQKDRETIEDFMERFKVETGRMKGALNVYGSSDSCMGDHPRGGSRPRRLNASNEGFPEDRERFRGVGESYDESYSHSYHDRDRSRHMKRRRNNESVLSSVLKSDSNDGRYRKSKSKRHKPTDEDDLTRP
uniref:Reverse transcriptase domain-containing protein n=1 Tax=Tanacetum cinerariifolium TaxID=118510 RepID=A0A699S4R4_TANCI|nr:hypothetical protein [Tanacetum cinerariifolium]